MSMCKDLTQRTTDFQKAIVNSQLHNRCSRDSSEILQKVQRGESTNLILYSVLLGKDYSIKYFILKGSCFGV